MGGAVAQVPENATAWANRRARWNFSIDSIWEDAGDSDRVIAWTRRVWSQLRERTNGGVYLNFAGLGEENDDLARAGYGINLDRLREVKRRYDPTNLFRGNINVRP
jgi:FAD/FMN-containing dehydrogenase